MNRRHFIKGASTAVAVPAILNGLPVSAMANSSLIQLLSQSGDCDDHVLVMIQLNGGNDGLNTVIPIDQYGKLAAARSNIIIPENKLLKLQNDQSVGLHPAMKRIHEMNGDGLVTLIQSVGYPNQDFSHFRSTDIWLSASDANVVEPTGWLGRYLQTEHPDFPAGYPNTDTPDPMAIQIGYVVSPAFMGTNGTMGMAITDADYFYQLLTDTENTSVDTPRGHELAFLRQTARQTNAYADRIKAAAANATNLSSLYPVGNPLADQLKIVSRMIAGGLKTKLYMVGISGFDTHSAQIQNGDTTQGAHAELLKGVSEAIYAFQDDLKLHHVDDRVLGMTFSEFGRRITSNGSLGTDHGAAAPMFLFGKSFPGKVIGANPTIPNAPTVNDNLPMETDFRSVYSSILKDWFCVEDHVVDGILGGDFEHLPLTTGINDIAGRRQLNIYPNPLVQSTRIHFESYGEDVKVELINTLGMRVKFIERQYFPAGQAFVDIDGRDLPSGNYFVRLSSKKMSVTQPIIKVEAH
ncbi:MAG: DUF1501 domain-containing protein [Bacteroidota bacterium]